MSYAMENEKEADRLEDQAAMSQYSVSREFDGIDFSKDAKVLDAGCGTGLLSRFLLDREPTLKLHAVDQSDLRIAQAKKLSQSGAYSSIQFSSANIFDLPFKSSTFDSVVCRFVLEHLNNPNQAIEEFKRILRPGGKIVLIDLDGVFVDYYSNDKVVADGLKLLESQLPFDLRIGRKLSHLLSHQGFNKIEWRGELLEFHGKDRDAEVKNFRDRLYFALPLFEKIMESKDMAETFVEAYLKDIARSESTLAFSKFRAVGTK